MISIWIITKQGVLFMTGFLNKILALGSLCILSMPLAWAGGVGVELLGAGTYSMAQGTPTPTADMGYGGGLILDFRLGTKTMFQLGGIYQNNVFKYDTVKM